MVLLRQVVWGAPTLCTIITLMFIAKTATAYPQHPSTPKKIRQGRGWAPWQQARITKSDLSLDASVPSFCKPMTVAKFEKLQRLRVEVTIRCTTGYTGLFQGTLAHIKATWPDVRVVKKRVSARDQVRWLLPRRSKQNLPLPQEPTSCSTLLLPARAVRH